MGVSFRFELYLECDEYVVAYHPDCDENLSLDQVDLPSGVKPTIPRLRREAIKAGWVLSADGKCYCPACAKRLGLT